MVALIAVAPLCNACAQDNPEEECASRTNEIFPIRSIDGVPSAGSRVKVEILFGSKNESSNRRSQVILAQDAAVCRSPNPALRPEDRGWIELSLGSKMTDLRLVKKIVGFDGFSVTVLPPDKLARN